MRSLSLLPRPLSSLLLSCLTLLTSLAIVRSEDPSELISQPLLHPNANDTLTTGTAFTIRWTPNSHFSNVTIELWDKTMWGYSRGFGDYCSRWGNPFCGSIAKDAPNTGSFVWNIPKPKFDFPHGLRVFWIKMYVDDYQKPEINNMEPVLSYSQMFAFALEPGQNATGFNPGPPSRLPHNPNVTGTASVAWPSPTDPWASPSNWSGETVAPTMPKASPTGTSLRNNTSWGMVNEPAVQGIWGIMLAFSLLFSVLLTGLN